MKNTFVLFAALTVYAVAPSLARGQIVTWTATSAPAQSTLAGGPWTLSQGANPETTYCTNAGTGVPIVNPTTTVNLFNPFYFPFVTGSGNNLQGYFDYRPDAINEAIMAAKSSDGGLTWTYQQLVASLSPDCPTSNPAAGNDAGEGHPHPISFLGTTWLYLLDRRNNYVDNAGLVVQRLTPNIPGNAPLNPVAGGTTFTPPASLPASVSLFSGWDFNNDSNTSVTFSGITGSPIFTINNSPAPSIGIGTATPLGMTNGYTFTTSPPNSGQQLRLRRYRGNRQYRSKQRLQLTCVARVRGLSNPVRAPRAKAMAGIPPLPQYSQGVEFDVSTAGHYHVVMQYDWYVTAQGFRNLQAQCNTNINNASGWTNIGPAEVTADGGGFVNQITLDFTALNVCSADDNPDFGVRMVGVYDPALGTYTGASAHEWPADCLLQQLR